LRNEAAAALARPDLREVKRFPAYFGEAGSSVVFTYDLERFIAPEPAGGFSVRATSNQTVLASFPGGQSKPARSFNLSPDDRQVAAVLGNYSLAVYPIEGGPPCLNWPGNAVQNACAGFHPRSAVIAGFIPGETLFLQDLTSSNRTSLGQSKGRVLFLQYDPSGNRLAVVRDGVEVWDCQGTPTLLWSQPSRKNTVPWLAWSPDASKLLTAADDGRGIRILTAANGQTEFVYSRHLLYPRQFEFHPNGRIIGSVGQDWVLRLWDARTGQDLVSGVGRHRVMRFSRDGRRLTTAPTDHELAVLELAPDSVFREFASASLDALPEVVPNGLACSTDGQLLLAVNPQVRLYDIRRGEQVAMLDPSASEQQAFFESNAPAILYSRLGRGIYRRQFACTTNSGTGSLAIEWGDEQLINTHPGAIIWNTVEGGRTWVRHGNGGVELWPNHDPSQARRVEAPIGPLGVALPGLKSVTTSQNGRWVARADKSRNRVTVWDVATSQVLTNLPARSPDRLWFSLDSQWLVASVESGYCTWSTDNWQPGACWEARLDSGDPGEVSFSQDGHFLIARQEREIFRLFSFPDCHELVTLKPPLVVPVRSACLNADGTRLWLLAAGYRVFEWNLAELRAELGKIGLDWKQ